MDKIVQVGSIAVTTGADYLWAQQNIILMDNSSNTVSRTVRSIGFKGTVLVSPGSANQKSLNWYAFIFVSNTDGILPNFAGNESALNLALSKYRKNIWLTDSGWVRADSGRTDDAIIEFDPGTMRKLQPGQKMYLVLMACYGDSSSGVAVTLSGMYDFVAFFE